MGYVSSCPCFPGLPFTARLNVHLDSSSIEYHEDSNWRDAGVSLSGHEDGQHKIIKDIRLSRAQFDYNPQAHVVCGGQIQSRTALKHGQYFRMLPERLSLGRRRGKRGIEGM